MRELRELTESMAAIMSDAEALIRAGDASREKLGPLRLRMASTITSFQFALDRKLTAITNQDDRRMHQLRELAKEWAGMATEFRAFTGLIQTSAAPPWPQYVTQARAFMRRFYDQMRRVSTLLPPD